MGKRFGCKWGTGVPRRTVCDNYWQQPLRWDRVAAKHHTHHTVFSASMADVFDIDGPIAERERLWALIRQTPNLYWQLLTKRPENIASMLPSDWGSGYPNVWLGTTIESQAYAHRVAQLTAIPAVIHFVSYEPALSALSLDWTGIDWVIVGGESGSRARPLALDWAYQVIEACQATATPVFVKQLGTVWKKANHASDSHASNPDDWPADLRVRQLPSL